MTFYNDGQNASSGFADLLSGGEHGLTFAQGIKSMLQKRRLDAQKAGDEHTQAGITQAVDLKTAGLEAAGPQAPTTGGGTVSPLDDPSNQPRSDGAMEVGGTTPISTGITAKPQQSPGLMQRVGHALSGMLHSNSGQNAGSHTTDAFTDRPGEAGKQLSERITDASQSGENSRLATTEEATRQRQLVTEGGLDSRNEQDNAARLKEAQIRAQSEGANRNANHADANNEKRINTLRQMLGQINATQHGFMGGMAMDKTGPEWTAAEHQKAAIRRELESLMQMKPNQLDGLDGDTPPNAQTPQTNGLNPSFFGGGLPPMGDALWESILARHGHIK